MATHTYAILEVSPLVFHEIAEKLSKAGYQHAFDNDGKTIDMHGVALESTDKTHHVELKDGTSS